MIKIEYIKVFGFEHAMRGMRQPFKMTDKGDSKWVPSWGDKYIKGFDYMVEQKLDMDRSLHHFEIGKKDLALAKKLANAGPDHGKFLRQIQVSMDITAPLFW